MGTRLTTWAFLPQCLRFACFPHIQQWLVPWYNLYLTLSSALVSSKSTILLCSEDVSWFPSCFRLIFYNNVCLTFLLLTHSESHVVGGCLCWGCLCFAVLFPLECWRDFKIRNSKFLALQHSWLFSSLTRWITSPVALALSNNTINIVSLTRSPVDFTYNYSYFH